MYSYDLNNGRKIPAIGLGVWQIEDGEQCAEVVSYALKAGCRLFDTATIYKNEYAVGEGLRRSGIPRGEVFITSKLWVQDMGYEKNESGD